MNGFEKPVALYLDEEEAVGWWWRIAARRDQVGLQGWWPRKVYPDFFVSLDEDGRTAKLLMLETKGGHLAGNPDTTFKQELFDALEENYAGAQEVGSLVIYDPPASEVRFRILYDGEGKAWRAKLAAALR